MKTKIKVIGNIQYESEDLKGKTGYIDGYVRGGNDVPLAVIVIDNRLILAETYSLEVIQ